MTKATDDYLLTPTHVGQIENADQLVNFFAALGYNVDRSIKLDHATLGMDSADLRQQIQRIRRVGEDPADGNIVIYLFEVRSVTVSLTQTIARRFRERTEDALLVLTKDFDSLDFVLLEREVAAGTRLGSGLRQIIRPRSLTVNRRNPLPVALRVLKRFTVTEEDSVFQWDKLRSAYTLAEWSEQYFNNRALFSDYYLLERLTDPKLTPAWSEDVRPIGREVMRHLSKARSTFSNQPEQVVREKLYEPLFQSLGFDFQVNKPGDSDLAVPDYILYAPGDRSKPIALAMTTVWNRNLDDVDEGRDPQTPVEIPGALVVNVLGQAEAKWVIVTNGKLWRLYSTTADNKATNTYEIDLEEAAEAPNQVTALTYWWLFFRRQAFTGFLDELLQQSADYAKGLGERLKDRTFTAIFPRFAEGFIQQLRSDKTDKSDREEELRSATIAGTVLTQERLGQDGFELRGLEDADVILIDEAHNFRNRRTKRYAALETLLAANGRRGRDGGRKKLILLTATPINNNIFDLYNQINLFTGNDRTYFSAAGIGDLYKYFLAARRDSVEQGSVRIFNLLEEVIVRRTRQFIRRAYPDATIGGKRITWPERRLITVRYDLEDTYEGFYKDIMRRIEALHLAHYNLETYKRPSEQQDEFELGREQALVGIFKIRFLKRLESSIEAFRISISRALAFAKTFDEYLQDDIILDSSSFQNAMRLLAADEEDSEVGNGDLPASLAEDLDASDEARQIIALLPRLDARKYDRRKLHHAMQEDVDALTDIWYKIKGIGLAEDAKLQRLRQLLATDLRGEKVLIFTYYKDTARYLQRGLTGPEAQPWLVQIGSPRIRRVDGKVKPEDRVRLVEPFAPVANNLPELAGSEREIDILVSTDVLSEGQNLQDCGILINYDLHWNPTRMVQRAGRIDRLGSPFDVLTIHNLFPEKALEELLGLVQRLTAKIDVINQTGFLDASVLGEVVTPRDFNTLRRIAAEDNSVIDEQESFLELASSEVLLAELQKILATEAAKWLTDLDDGIHSGLQRPYERELDPCHAEGRRSISAQSNLEQSTVRAQDPRHVEGRRSVSAQSNLEQSTAREQDPRHAEGRRSISAQSSLEQSTARGIFFYFTAPHPDGGRHHFWRYYDLLRRQIVDNRYQIMQLIACGPETPRFPPPYHEIDVYDLQDKVIQAILADIELQQAVAIVDKPVAEEQNIASHILRQHLSASGMDRAELKQLRNFLKQPLVGASVTRLRDGLQVYSASNDIAPLVQTVRELYQQQAPLEAPQRNGRLHRPVTRDDLHLVCYEYLT